MARDLHARIDRPNALVKIPATAEGVPAIRQMIGEGRSINVTLIFSLARYDEVIEAYLSGLEALAAVGSRRPVERGQRGVLLRQPGRHRGGPAASRRASAAEGRRCSGPAGHRPRWPRPGWPTSCSSGASPGPLGGAGRTRAPGSSARCGRRPRPRTRPIRTWPTSTRLIGPDTVNTMPDGTIADFLDHGTVARTVDADLDEAERLIADLADRRASTWKTWPQTLEAEGVASFAKSFDELLQIAHRQGQRPPRPVLSRESSPTTRAAAERPGLSAEWPAPPEPTTILSRRH